ncbi:nicotinate phosphoribosyltransferase-like isoform X2 [Symsagittifera roscoffensis]|uniref:nicotinate phosphoribosyltransferase-like isoform X2 n=1 Tax=Symsagittifera roscoffensis TaxID=84072 RepID=UPI00307BFE9B
MQTSQRKDSGMYGSVVQPLLTDLYQITMCYGYWRSNKHNQNSVFELFFRKNPFKGEFTIFCGLRDVIVFLENFTITDEDVQYLKSVMPDAEPEFFHYMQSLDPKQMKIRAQKEGSVCFPRVPLITLEGPLALCQLVETTLLTLVNFASLVATNAVRYRLAAGDDKILLEFGLRRAQGPDGGLTASKYCYVGGFNATSNVLAGKMYGIPIKGTQAHSFVTSFSKISELKEQKTTLKSKNGAQECDLVDLTIKYLEDVKNVLEIPEIHEGELASFIAYACAFPENFLVLIDTYATLGSGIASFLAVALALDHIGYRATGVRIDSGDLAYQSHVVHDKMCLVADRLGVEWFKTGLTIVASNDLDEETLYSFRNQDHKINAFGIGTNLVTCLNQPALGCVYKIVEIEGRPCMKLAQEVGKMTFPGNKKVYRLQGSQGTAILDLISTEHEPKPEINQPVLCRDPFTATKRAYCKPSSIQELLVPVWDENGCVEPVQTLQEVREFVLESLKSLRADVKRKLNPTPYKVSLSNKLFDFMHDQWLQNAPIGQLD